MTSLINFRVVIFAVILLFFFLILTGKVTLPSGFGKVNLDTPHTPGPNLNVVTLTPPAPPSSFGEGYVRVLEQIAAATDITKICPHLRNISRHLQLTPSQSCQLIKIIDRRIMEFNVAPNRKLWSGETAAHQLRTLMKNYWNFTEPSAVVLDVGANIGEAVMWWNFFSNDTTWYLHEPVAKTVEFLHHKFDSNPNVHIIQTAISNYTGSVAFQTKHTTAGWRRGQLGTSNRTRRGQPNLLVPVQTLDSLYLKNSSSWPPMLMLGIDAEGWDHTVLQGARKLLEKIPMVLWECHVLQLLSRGGAGTTHHDSEQLLRSYNMVSFKLAQFHFVRFDGQFYDPLIDDPANMGWSNCFAIRRDSPFYNRIITEMTCLHPKVYETCERKM